MNITISLFGGASLLQYPPLEGQALYIPLWRGKPFISPFGGASPIYPPLEGVQGEDNNIMQ